MATGILILGESGTGKSTSLENLPPKETFIINIKGKSLPFKGWKNNYSLLSKDNPNGNYLQTESADAIIKTMQHVSENMKHIKYLIVEDFQYMAASEFMNRASEKGFDKFTSIGKNIYSVADYHNKLREDLIVVYINHLEEFTNEMGDRKLKAKTVGKLVDNVVTLEGLFTIVLYTKVKKGKEGMEYVFETQNNGSNTAKSPKGMFPTMEIPNDLKYVTSMIDEYYK